jgi:hypothetical protein
MAEFLKSIPKPPDSGFAATVSKHTEFEPSSVTMTLDFSQELTVKRLVTFVAT